MSPFSATLLAALGSAQGASASAADPPAPAAPAGPIPDQHPIIAAIHAASGHGALLVALFGCALLAFMLAPERNRLAVSRLSNHPLASFAIGLLLLLPAAVLLAWILHHTESRHGRGALAIYLLAASATGLAVCARALAERVSQESPPLLLVSIGLLALICPLASLLGMPVLLIGAPLGLGAWVSAGRARPTPR
jgi:hypothetical protein